MIRLLSFVEARTVTGPVKNLLDFARRVHSLALHLAVCHMRRVDTRLLVILWHLADRWGRVEPDGVHVPLRLTHQSLGRLVGAQRPSVTTALKQLGETDQVMRREDGTWLLTGEPPDALERLRETAQDAPHNEAA